MDKEVDDIKNKDNRIELRMVELKESIDKLNNNLHSAKRVIARGLLNGFATAVGASLVFASFIFALAKVVDSVKDIPILDDIIQELQIEQLVNQLANNVDKATETTPTPTPTVTLTPTVEPTITN